ncbi:ATP-binding protein [Streptomyces sp. NPDC048479]|uniref:ATP-binding protein n=1 Tax=Streptomyces sp. NPDC048479 TaxID=3154725 RepID=UPI0034441A50
MASTRDQPARPEVVHRVVDLESQIRAPRYARHVLKDVLEEKKLLSASEEKIRDQAHAALLVVSELVTNACRHATGPREMRLIWHGRVLLIEVDDASGMFPAVVPDAARGPDGGYGLGLVEELVDGWDVLPNSEGKTVQVSMEFPQ